MTTNKNFVVRNEPVKFFKGLEIELTNHFLHPTLFSPGQYDYDECVALLKEHKINHMFLAYMYDHQKNPLTMDVPRAMELANRLMDDGYRVSFELRADQLTDEFVALCPEPGSSRGGLLAVMVGTYAPHMHKIGAYTTVKLYSDFYSDNGGVWCIKAPDFMKNGVFTPWEAYAADVKLK